MTRESVTGKTMTETIVAEAVGRFESREAFKSAVEALLAAGFEHADLSVLDSHDSLAAAEGRNTAWRDTLRGLVGEVSYIEPLTAAGLILLASGAVGAAISGAIAAGLGGAALYEALRDVSAAPHAQEFATALKNGAVLLWVRADDPARQARACDILKARGAADVHVNHRTIVTESA